MFQKLNGIWKISYINVSKKTQRIVILCNEKILLANLSQQLEEYSFKGWDASQDAALCSRCRNREMSQSSS